MKQLFYPNKMTTTSDSFVIPIGGQVTVFAFGLEPDDEITFDMLYVPSLAGDPCDCPPGGQAELPQAAAVERLRCCGESIRLTYDNPYVILDSPQNIFIRANLEAEDTMAVTSWLVTTNTPNVNDRLRGCQCGE